MPYVYKATFLVTHTGLNIKYTTARATLYWSFIESQNGCFDNSNPNSVIGSRVNRFETPVRFDIFTRRFSLSSISVVNLSMTFLYFSPIEFLSQFWVSLSSITSYAVSSDVILLDFGNSILAVSWNIGIVNSPYLVGREISTLSLSLQMWYPVASGINLSQIVFAGGSSKWRMFGMVLKK